MSPATAAQSTDQTPPSGMTVVPTTPGIATVGEAVQNSFNSATEYCSWKNPQLAQGYNDLCDNLTIQIQNGAQNVVWPTVPARFVVIMNSDGFYTYEQSGPPVCPARAEPPKKGSLADQIAALPANQISIGAQLGVTAFYAVNFEDTWPLNKKTPPTQVPGAADGTLGVFVKIPAPVGTTMIKLADGSVVAHGGWYELVG